MHSILFGSPLKSSHDDICRAPPTVISARAGSNFFDRFSARFLPSRPASIVDRLGHRLCANWQSWNTFRARKGRCGRGALLFLRRTAISSTRCDGRARDGCVELHDRQASRSRSRLGHICARHVTERVPIVFALRGELVRGQHSEDMNKAFERMDIAFDIAAAGAELSCVQQDGTAHRRQTCAHADGALQLEDQAGRPGLIDDRVGGYRCCDGAL